MWGLPTDSPHALFLGLLKSVPGLCDMWGLPTDSPHALFLGLLKSVPSLCELDQNRPYVVCLNC